MKTLDKEPNRPRGDTYKGKKHWSHWDAMNAWRDDWMRWARREIKRLRGST